MPFWAARTVAHTLVGKPERESETDDACSPSDRDKPKARMCAVDSLSSLEESSTKTKRVL